MVLERVRSYQKEVLKKIFDMEDMRRNFLTCSMGSVNLGSTTYPLFYATVGAKDAVGLKYVLISAGIHGEEPAGVYALLCFLEQDIHHFLGSYRFLIFPCINPFGFEHNYRFSPGRFDINREFKIRGRSSEANEVMSVLGRKPWKFDLAIDLHETDPSWADEGFRPEDNPHTFYMWESCLDRGIRIGDKVIAEVEKFAPVCKWPLVYKDVNSGGVIWYPEGCLSPVYAQGTTLDGFLNAHYSPQTFTLETPCGWSMDKRILIHCTALRSILELKRDA